MTNAATLGAFALAIGLGTALLASPPAHAQEALRPAVGKPLAQAKSLLNAGRYANAMAAVRQADAAAGKTAHEQLVINEMRAAIASRSGDMNTAANAYKALLDSGAVSGAEALNMMQGEVSIAYTQKNYANVVYWAERYLKAGGTAPAVYTSLLQGYYLQGKYAEAARLQQQQIAAETRGGKAPREEQLQLLYSCQQHMGDKTGQLATIKQLIAYYPKPDYWLNMIDTVRTRPGFSDRLLLDIYRIEFSLGLVNKPDEAMDYAELAVQAGLPGEAKDVVDKSFAGGLLGTGPEASRHQRLRNLVNKAYTDGKAALGKEDANAATDHDGNHLLALGETYVSYGDFARGLPMMEQGIAKDDLRHPEDAKLQLGIAYWKAGQTPKALAELRSVGGNEGVADVAALWMLRIKSAK
jgi:tetratricopeptide (TPR) repeat protein